MAEATVIKPDLDFVKGVIEAGGESLKKCYQCATCSVVCNVTPDQNPFPRKEMIWAQWGLKEKFIGNPDVWLCHQCNDCTVYCPRGAKPGEVLGAIRKQTISQYSKPGFLVNMVNNKALVWLIFLIPALLLGLVLSADGIFIPAEGELIFSNFASTLQIQLVFVHDGYRRTSARAKDFLVPPQHLTGPGVDGQRFSLIVVALTAYARGEVNHISIASAGRTPQVAASV